MNKKLRESTMEGDKIISEFMNVEVWEDKDHDVLWTGDLADETLSCIDYSYDYNSIMTVFDKIESLGYGIDVYKLFTNPIFKDNKDVYHVEICEIEKDGSYGTCIVEVEDGPTRVMSLWKSFIRFIEWYKMK
jgi:hypothetical protein